MTVAKTQIMIHGPENPLFLQIQDGTHISLSNSGCNSECSCTVTAESWSTTSLEDQQGSRMEYFKGYSMASTNGLWWGQQKAEECGLRVKDAQEFSSQTFSPTKWQNSLCLYSQKCLDCFNWHLPRKEKKKKPGKTLATSKFSLSGQSLADKSNWKKKWKKY